MCVFKGAALGADIEHEFLKPLGCSGVLQHVMKWLECVETKHTHTHAHWFERAYKLDASSMNSDWGEGVWLIHKPAKASTHPIPVAASHRRGDGRVSVLQI
eukprot:3925527-Amphidinium_carterae.2